MTSHQTICQMRGWKRNQMCRHSARVFLHYYSTQHGERKWRLSDSACGYCSFVRRRVCAVSCYLSCVRWFIMNHPTCSAAHVQLLIPLLYPFKTNLVPFPAVTLEQKKSKYNCFLSCFCSRLFFFFCYYNLKKPQGVPMSHEDTVVSGSVNKCQSEDVMASHQRPHLFWEWHHISCRKADLSQQINSSTHVLTTSEIYSHSRLS